MSRKLLTRDRSVRSSEAKSFLVFNIVEVLNVGYGAPQKHRGLFIAQMVKLELIFGMWVYLPHKDNHSHALQTYTNKRVIY